MLRHVPKLNLKLPNPTENLTSSIIHEVVNKIINNIKTRKLSLPPALQNAFNELKNALYDIKIKEEEVTSEHQETQTEEEEQVKNRRIKNNGQPRDSSKMTNQCFWISLSDWFTIMDDPQTVSLLRNKERELERRRLKGQDAQYLNGDNEAINIIKRPRH